MQVPTTETVVRRQLVGVGGNGKSRLCIQILPVTLSLTPRCSDGFGSTVCEHDKGRLGLRLTIFVAVLTFFNGTIFALPQTANAAKPGSFCLRQADQRACFEVVLDVQAEATTPVLSPVSLKELSWTVKDGTYIGMKTGPVWHATVTLTPTDGAVALSIVLHYAVEAMIEREVVIVRLPGTGRMITRALTFIPTPIALRVDRGTPIFVTAGDLAIVGGTGLVAARYQPSPKRSKAPATEVQLILDDRAAHPFSVYPRCLDKLSTPEGNWLGLEQHRVAKDRLTRAAGTTMQAQAVFYLTDSSVVQLPVIIERWEAGAKAAFIITDHADRTDPQALRAILYGTSDKAAPEYGQRGFFGHGLKLTKTFFASGKRGTLDDDPEIRALAAEILAAGSEVGSHSISARKDTRQVVEKGLASFDPWQTVTWIDHQPYTNCEALSNLGWNMTDPYGIEDLLVAHGYRWLWTASDFNRWGLQLGNLFGGEPTMAMPVFFPFPPDPRLWVFRSEWFYAPPAQLAATMNDAALAKLEEQRGIFVAHTYLSASATTTRESAHRQALAVHPAGNGALAIDAALDAALARVGTRVHAGTMASLTWREAGDRLRALGGIETHYLSDGSVAIENRGTADLPGLTVAIPTGNAEFTITGSAVAGTRKEAGRSTIWFSLGKGTQVKLSATIDGKRIPFLPMQTATLEAL